MFWYLGILGRNVTEEKKANVDEKKEEVKPVIKGTPPKPADTGSAAKPGTVTHRPLSNSAPPRADVPVENRPTPVQPAPTKKSSLSKPERARDGRNSEAPMRAPSYGAQTAQVDQEVRNQMMNQQMGGIMRGPPPQHAQSQPSQGPAGSYSQIHPSPQQSQRPMASSGPARALSPPSPGVNGPRSPEGGYHRDIPSAARGVPQSSFGPPPPPGGPSGQVMGEDRRDMRQRTLSNPNLPHPGPTPPPGGASPRRVVTEGRMPAEGAPRPPYPQHSGPQPGQLFQYPAGAAAPSFARPASPGPQPGQVFNHPRLPPSRPPQPGQIFQHPQHHPHPQARPPPSQYGQRPLPPPGQAQGWEPPQRLPPGASPPQWAGARPPTQQGTPGFDPRRGYAPQSQGQPQGYYGGAGPAPGPGQPMGRPVAVQQGQGYFPAGEYGHHR